MITFQITSRVVHIGDGNVNDFPSYTILKIRSFALITYSEIIIVVAASPVEVMAVCVTSKEAVARIAN